MPMLLLPNPSLKKISGCWSFGIRLFEFDGIVFVGRHPALVRLISNCASNDAGSVDGVQQLLKEAIASADKKITKRCELEKMKGGMPEDFPSKERERLLLDLRQGHVLRARAGISRKTMEAELDFRVKMVLFL